MKDFHRKGDSLFGAQMGRGNQDLDLSEPLTLERVTLYGDYDKGGAYWGGGKDTDPLWCVTDHEGSVSYIRAKSQKKAFAHFPNAIWKRNKAPRNKDELLGSLDDFTKAYLETAIWSSNDESDERGGKPLDANYSIEDFTVKSLRGAIEDCKAFQKDNASDLEGIKPSQAGHDFWLTRNDHGVGFSDRGLGDVGVRLKAACRPYGTVYLMVYRGKIHGS